MNNLLRITFGICLIADNEEDLWYKKPQATFFTDCQIFAKIKLQSIFIN